MVVISSFSEFEAFTGKEIGVSDYLQITQEQISKFADATLDHQWIHLDTERAERETPFKSTIAHGYLSLSLVAGLGGQVYRIDKRSRGVNYGLNKVRFPSPVRVGSRLRGRFKLLEVEQLDGCMQSVWQMTLECEGLDKPVCVAESVLSMYL